MKKLSQEQFQQFEQECRRLQKEWGLNQLKLFFYFKPLVERYAESEVDLGGATASIRLTTELSPLAYKDFNVLEAAKHEMIHVLLGKLAVMGHTRFLDIKSIQEAEEECVRILEKIL